MSGYGIHDELVATIFVSYNLFILIPLWRINSTYISMVKSDTPVQKLKLFLGYIARTATIVLAPLNLIAFSGVILRSS